MNMSEKKFDDRDEQAAWDLLGQHRGIEPSFGFVERTLRRLDTMPTHPVWRRVPVLRWASGACLACIVAIGAVHQYHLGGIKRAEIYAIAQQDRLDDFDVIASLDVLNGEHRL
jgi:hypothetical protein